MFSVSTITFIKIQSCSNFNCSSIYKTIFNKYSSQNFIWIPGGAEVTSCTEVFEFESNSNDYTVIILNHQYNQYAVNSFRLGGLPSTLFQKFCSIYLWIPSFYVNIYCNYLYFHNVNHINEEAQYSIKIYTKIKN